MNRLTLVVLIAGIIGLLLAGILNGKAEQPVRPEVISPAYAAELEPEGWDSYLYVTSDCKQFTVRIASPNSAYIATIHVGYGRIPTFDSWHEAVASPTYTGWIADSLDPEYYYAYKTEDYDIEPSDGSWMLMFIDGLGSGHDYSLEKWCGHRLTLPLILNKAH